MRVRGFVLVMIGVALTGSRRVVRFYSAGLSTVRATVLGWELISLEV
jgi:hypothetical protein